MVSAKTASPPVAAQRSAFSRSIKPAAAAAAQASRGSQVRSGASVAR
jgi:hypothetical protein